MAINPFEEVDYLQVARDRVTSQFEDQQVFDKYIQLLTMWQEELQSTLKDLKQKRSIDTAEGEQLDILGRIVGQPREIAARDYNIIQNEGEDPVRVPVTLTDEMYRIFIKARILKNVTDTTPEQVIESFKFLFDVDKVVLTEVGYATVRIDVSKKFSNFELAVLEYAKREKNLLPIAVGVGFDIGVFQAGKFFAFQGVEGAQGFGSLISTVSYNGSLNHSGSSNYDGVRELKKVLEYEDFLDGSSALDGSLTLDGSLLPDSEILGGYLSSIIDV